MIQQWVTFVFRPLLQIIEQKEIKFRIFRLETNAHDENGLRKFTSRNAESSDNGVGKFSELTWNPK